MASDIDPVTDVSKAYWSAEAGPAPQTDSVAVEEPLEITLSWHTPDGVQRREVITVTMRTPGDDRELALGLLHGEGLVREPAQVADCTYFGEEGPGRHNQLEVRLKDPVNIELDDQQRHLVTQSSCGICGKTSLQAIEMKSPPPIDADSGWLSADVLRSLATAMRASQARFQQTGGVHAAAVFSSTGELQLLREDVGRHNALDKLVGADRYDAARGEQDNRRILMLSGRVSFELVQKAVMAALPVVAAVGAPSSLAISLAQRFDLTLVGFLGEQGFSVYSGQHRLIKP